MKKNELTIEEITKLISAGKQGYGRYEGIFRELSSAYIGKMDDKLFNSLKKRGKSTLFIPAVNGKVKKLHTSFLAAYFTNDTFAGVSPSGFDENSGKIAEAIEKAMDYYQKTKLVNLYNVFNSAFLNVIILGTCFVRVFWKNGIPQIEEIHISNAYPDPAASNIQEMNYFVHRMYLTVQELEEVRSLQSFGDFEVPHGNGINDYNKHEVFDVYYKKNGRWFLSTLLGGEIIRNAMELKDGFPIFTGTLIPQHIAADETDPVRVYGDSIIAPLLPLQLELNHRRNQMSDAINEQVNPRMLVEAGGGVNPADLKKGAGTHIVCNNLNSIRPLPAPNILQAAQDVQQIDLEMQESIGVTSYNTGIDSLKLNDTATGISIISQEANQRIDQLIRAINETLIEPLFKHIAMLVWRYGDERFFKDIDVSRETDPELFVYVNTGLGATNKQIRLNGLRQAFDMAMHAGNIKAVNKLFEDMLPVLGIKNIQEYKNERTDNETDPIST